MANYYAYARSNYFRVKNVKDFEKWCDKCLLDMHCKDKNSSQVMIHPNEYSDYCGWPSEVMGENDIEEIDVVAGIAGHIVPGDVCILEEIGYEKLRYLTAHILAITSEGLVREDGFHSIIQRWQKELENKFSLPEY